LNGNNKGKTKMQQETQNVNVNEKENEKPKRKRKRKYRILKTIGYTLAFCIVFEAVGQARDYVHDVVRFAYDRALNDAEAKLYELGFQKAKEEKQLTTSERNQIIAHEASLYGLNPDLIRAVIHAESAGNPYAESHAGAIGLMQIMPANAKRCGLESSRQLWDERINIACGVQILAEELKTYNGDIVSALAAYNGGHKRVAKPVKETFQHRKRILDQLAKAK
jgi:soluble lytic murein transglycosylase-like protein